MTKKFKIQKDRIFNRHGLIRLRKKKEYREKREIEK